MSVLTCLPDNYFEKIDSSEKAYVFGKLIFNIREVILNNKKEPTLKICINQEIIDIGLELKNDTDEDFFIIDSTQLVVDICKHHNIDYPKLSHMIDIEHFVKKNNRDIVIEYLKAYYEHNGNIIFENDTYKSIITCYDAKNSSIFADYFGIPYENVELFNLKQIVYKGVNIVDLLGMLYSNHEIKSKSQQYVDFVNLLNNDTPIIKYTIEENAVCPKKAHMSDVGHDLTVIEIYKKINSRTILCKTGIKLDIPVGYYVEIVPRSSIMKSGYILANSIGIIDCSYKGELMVALTKIDTDSPDIEFPFKCCQIVVRKQVFQEFVITSEICVSKRNTGGFGSSG